MRGESDNVVWRRNRVIGERAKAWWGEGQEEGKADVGVEGRSNGHVRCMHWAPAT